jgi:hypothetical protein
MFESGPARVENAKGAIASIDEHARLVDQSPEDNGEDEVSVQCENRLNEPPQLHGIVNFLNRLHQPRVVLTGLEAK